MKLPFSFKFKCTTKQVLQNKGVVFAFYLLCLFPFALLIFAIQAKSERFDEYSQQIAQMGIRIQRTLEMRQDNHAFFKKYGEIDRYYLDHVLEAATFLKPEVEALELVYGHPAFESCDNVKKRLDFLVKGDNRLMFSEANRQCKNQVEELDLKQKYPVEINSEDLKNLLSLVEGVSIEDYLPPVGAPQLIVQRLTLRRKKLAERETFLLEMQLIKRETIK